MRIVLQRVSEALVEVEGEVVGAIAQGFVALVGVAAGDGAEQAEALATKTAELRVFADAAGKFNRSLQDVGGAALVVSQFTLLADVRKGRRPSFRGAAEPSVAAVLVERYATALEEQVCRWRRGGSGRRCWCRSVTTGR